MQGLPIPPVDFLTAMIDVLAKRYGWSFTEIREEMYWEHVYEMYEYASNLEAMEKNEEMRFQFLLHAQTKEAVNSWKDLPIPFPDTSIVNPVPSMIIKTDSGEKRVSDTNADLSPSFRKNFNARPMTPEQRERRDYVAKRQADHFARMRRIRAEQYRG